MSFISRRKRLGWFFAAAALVGNGAELPVKNVVLYKHGIGYFERAGAIGPGEEARLDFKNGDMNDILKSLTVTDHSGERVSAIRYDSNATLEQQLQDFPFQIAQGERLSAFLDGLRGARLEVKTSDRAVTGAIVSARALSVAAEGNPAPGVLREQVTLLLDTGEMVNFDLAGLASMRLSDPALQQKLKDYLLVVSKAKARDKRSIYIDSVGSGARELKVSYIAPVAIWKSSYRLTLGDAKSRLEGWAIVDNTTDEDWNNVGLSVVSGRPISFISLLDQPRFGSRQVAELPEDQAAAPVVYEGALESAPPPPPPPAALMAPKVAFGVGDGYGSGSGGGMAGGAFRSHTVTKAEANTVQVATGATLGELFEYNFATPVTVKHNQSAMLPFLQDQVAARKLLIYTGSDSEHPVNAAEITNTSGKTLDGGPITVYDGGAYAGEALVETFKAGDKRLIGYAVDYGTRVTTNFESGDENVLEIHANSGTLEIKTSERSTTTYEVKNVDNKAKTLIVQQTAEDDFRVLSPKPTERAAKANRFEIQVGANASQVLKVERERVISDAMVVSSSTVDSLVEIISGKGLSEAGRTQLQHVIELKRRLTAAQGALDANKVSADELAADQNRLRQNIDSLNKVSGEEDKVRQYSTRLNDNEIKLAAARDQRDELKRNVADLTREVADAVAKLRF